jgi:hypothetical protein
LSNKIISLERQRIKLPLDTAIRPPQELENFVVSGLEISDASKAGAMRLDNVMLLRRCNLPPS